MEDAVDALERSAQAAPVEDVAPRGLVVEAAQVVETGAVTQQEPQIVAPLGQGTRDV